MEIVDIGYSSNAFKTFLFGEEVKLVDSNFSVKEIRADFDKHISEKWDFAEIKKAVTEYEKNILVYLNEYLFALKEGLPFSLGPKYDIEHIMPISGVNLDTIRRDAQIESKDEFNHTVNKLGNKILLEVIINRSIGNEWFSAKVSTKLEDKTGYIDSSYPLASSLVKRYANETKPYWCKRDIDEATEKASSRIVDFIFGN